LPLIDLCHHLLHNRDIRAALLNLEGDNIINHRAIVAENFNWLLEKLPPMVMLMSNIPNPLGLWFSHNKTGFTQSGGGPASRRRRLIQTNMIE
jgi:hypothetical protein